RIGVRQRVTRDRVEVTPVIRGGTEVQPSLGRLRGGVHDRERVSRDGLVQLVAGGGTRALHRRARGGEQHEADERDGLLHASDLPMSSACCLVMSPSTRTIVPPSSRISVLVARRSVSGYGLPLASTITNWCGAPEIQ